MTKYAFPTTHFKTSNVGGSGSGGGGVAAVNDPGMTLRDYFAGQALSVAWTAWDKGYFEGDTSDIAKSAYQIADAMIKARAEQ